MSDYQMHNIQGSINDRQKELHSVTDFLAAAAQQASLRAAAAKIIIVLLGAFVATREAANQLIGASNTITIVSYTLAGLLIAVVAGLEAAFKWESRAADLRTLAAICQSTVRLVDSQWQKDIGSAPIETQLDAARKLLDLQDTKLTEVQEKAAALGVNITLAVRELFRDRDMYAA
jgi:hypothetical protein